MLVRSIGKFPISRDPPEGGTSIQQLRKAQKAEWFPISRDPPEGGTWSWLLGHSIGPKFPISRDPPEGGTPLLTGRSILGRRVSNF